MDCATRQTRENGFLPDEPLVFIDIEVAGSEIFRPIIQLAAIAVDSEGNELESYEAKLRFHQRYANKQALSNKRHYCERRWLTEAKDPHVVAEELSQLFERHACIDQVAGNGRVYQVAQLVAHHAEFDGAHLKAWFERMRLFLPASPRVLCTVQRAMWAFHEDKSLTPPPDYKLLTLCQYFGIPFSEEEAHNALNDVRATVALYRAMNKVSRNNQQMASIPLTQVL